MSSTDIVQRSPQAELVAQVRSEQFQEQLALALPEGVRRERFVRSVATALLDNPDLADPEKVERTSVFQAVLKSAQDGLVPDGREAALVVFGRKAQYMPMIGGFRKIAGEHGWTIRTAVVHEADEFEVELGVDPKVRHVPPRPGSDRGEIIAAYAVGAHGDGRREVEVMDLAEIEKVRAVSRSSGRGPWVDWFERMAEKTVGRRLFAKLPLGDRERIERVLEASRAEPVDATTALYGNGQRSIPAGVDRETGEILPPPGEEARPASPPHPQQAAEAVPSDPVSAVPEDDDGEPEFGERAALGSLKPPTGKHKALTLDEIAAMGTEGWQWLHWATSEERTWHRDGHPHADFGRGVRAYVAEKMAGTKEQS